MSVPAVTRIDFQQLADVRIDEALTLLGLGKWDGAYYLAGYAVEMALKACIIKAVMATDAFPDKGFSASCWTHDLGKLLDLAGLSSARVATATADPIFAEYWIKVKDWKEDRRYHRMTEDEARKLCEAVSDAAHGVLPWIRSHY